MNKFYALVAAAALVCAAPAFGQATKAPDAKAPDAKAPDAKMADTAKTTNPQQEKMKTCNEQAGDKKGDERKAFMKTCLSAKPAPPPKAESKMAMCNKKTAGMAKEERAKAQSECMKGA
jgi:hypothetical protein